MSGSEELAQKRAAKTGGPVDDETERRRRVTTAFGWIAGGSLGLLLNYAFFLAIGPEGYPTVVTTFVLFLAGAFGGMSLADRLGPRGFRPLGIAAGVFFSLFLALVIAVLASPPQSELP